MQGNRLLEGTCVRGPAVHSHLRVLANKLISQYMILRAATRLTTHVYLPAILLSIQVPHEEYISTPQLCM